MSILVSGGAGYIGSHTCVELIQAGYDIVVADNLVNSSREAIRRVEQIVGRQVPFVEAELCDPEQVEALFQSHPDIRVALEQRFHLLWVAQLRLNEGDLPSHDLLHPPDRFPAGIHQIVRHHDVISRLDQLHTGVAADISGATAHQNGHRSLLFCHDPLSLGKLL